MTAMFVNLPVTDPERAKAFYTAIGLSPRDWFDRLTLATGILVWVAALIAAYAGVLGVLGTRGL